MKTRCTTINVKFSRKDPEYIFRHPRKVSKMGWNGSVKVFLSTDYVLKKKVREHLRKEAVQIKPEWP